MSKYICPLCSKIYYNVNDLASCTNRDAKAISEKENKIKETERKIAQIKIDLDQTKKVIKQDYKTLSEHIEAYNQLGLKLTCLSPNSGVHCASSLSFSDDKNSSNFIDLREIGSQIKKTKTPKDEQELNDLIERIFGF